MTIARIRPSSFPGSSRLGDFVEDHLTSRSPTTAPIDKHALALYLIMIMEKLNELIDAVNAMDDGREE